MKIILLLQIVPQRTGIKWKRRGGEGKYREKAELSAGRSEENLGKAQRKQRKQS